MLSSKKLELTIIVIYYCNNCYFMFAGVTNINNINNSNYVYMLLFFFVRTIKRYR